MSYSLFSGRVECSKEGCGRHPLGSRADEDSVDTSMDITRDGPLQVSWITVPRLAIHSRVIALAAKADAVISYSLSLREIDQMRVDGKFVDAEGNKAEGQYVSGESSRRYHPIGEATADMTCHRPCSSFFDDVMVSFTDSCLSPSPYPRNSCLSYVRTLGELISPTITGHPS